MGKKKRAADQDAAIEKAFQAGTLPEEDRRAPEDLGGHVIPPGGFEAIHAALEPAPVFQLIQPDAGALVYRDRAAKPFGTGPSEGKNNLGAVTAAARASLPDNSA